MSELALELIAKEKEERTGHLALGNCELTEIPEEVLKGCIRATLTYHKVKHLPFLGMK